MNPNVETTKNQVTIEIDEKIFPRPTVVAASYVFLDRCYVRLERAPRSHVKVRLKGKRKLAKARLVELSSEFENELLHQLMRHQVGEKTHPIREVIVGRALLSAEPQAQVPPDGAGPGDLPPEAEPEEDLDYLDDPLGIAVPWEEKYGDDKKEEE
jgi:His-Xaa-Ser system protein HxsD